MSYKDLFLPLLTSPEAAPSWPVEAAAAFAAALSARITAVAFTVDVVAPRTFLSDMFMDLPALVASEEKRSADNGLRLLADFEAAAGQRGVIEGASTQLTLMTAVRDAVAAHARLHDLTLLPVGKVDLADQWCAESAIFDTGRPALLLPNTPSRNKAFELNSVVVAWDFSPAASRALADAIPILKQARHVTILTVENEKKITTSHSIAELQQHLERHAIKTESVSIDARGRRIGDALGAYLEAVQADLLVMGAYGHTRMREFVLGGATRSMLAETPLPVLLSH